MACGLTTRDADIIKTPITETRLEELADRLHLSFDRLVNKKHSRFKKPFRNPNLSNDD
ncbi:hypothetical protein K8354_01700 [Polaribacter litorisediminis]|uniref:arsenate reductase family protein n=1 Tax=Polaribacter litorisediminis TaxID=1908341 RepID=UPI001CBEC07D|nr:hypothetical protein [Polaribacter litorisediminis]UAM98569.1 hypothetical protein K8354_01700 [Polaribacter litorisediminis]